MASRKDQGPEREHPVSGDAGGDPVGEENEPIVIPPSAKSPGDFFRIGLVILAVLILILLPVTYMLS